MLVLTRKAKQQIQIGPNITITILQVKGQAVRVGVEAPREVCVLRTELAEKLADASSDPTVVAAAGKAEREAKRSATVATNDQAESSAAAANTSLRCRAPRVDSAPLNSPYPPASPASFQRTRRLRLAIR